MLEELALQLHLDYLSELRGAGIKALLIQALCKLKEEEYSADEWRETACYIMPQMQIQEGISIKKQLLDALEVTL